MRILLCLIVVVSIVAGESAPSAIGVPVHYTLPADGSPSKAWRVTLAIVDAKNPDWIISQFAAGVARTVTAKNGAIVPTTIDLAGAEIELQRLIVNRPALQAIVARGVGMGTQMNCGVERGERDIRSLHHIKKHLPTWGRVTWPHLQLRTDGWSNVVNFSHFPLLASISDKSLLSQCLCFLVNISEFLETGTVKNSTKRAILTETPGSFGLIVLKSTDRSFKEVREEG